MTETVHIQVGFVVLVAENGVNFPNLSSFMNVGKFEKKPKHTFISSTLFIFDSLYIRLSRTLIIQEKQYV